MARENEDECPSFLWYFVASFGYTLLILLILVAYLIMYSSHFMWALSKKKGPKLKNVSKGSKSATDSRGSSEMKDSKENKEEKGNKESRDD
uniref:ATP synthase F0 subunit 8 n=1 Tax=Parascaris univalens TaxID=6257 RepID=A0A915C4A8_PARUN